MSRIGKAPIAIPAGVSVDVKENVVTVKGPKGTLTQTINPELDVKIEDGHVTLTRPSEGFTRRFPSSSPAARAVTRRCTSDRKSVV